MQERLTVLLNPNPLIQNTLQVPIFLFQQSNNHPKNWSILIPTSPERLIRMRWKWDENNLKILSLSPWTFWIKGSNYPFSCFDTLHFWTNAQLKGHWLPNLFQKPDPRARCSDCLLGSPKIQGFTWTNHIKKHIFQRGTESPKHDSNIFIRESRKSNALVLTAKWQFKCHHAKVKEQLRWVHLLKSSWNGRQKNATWCNFIKVFGMSQATNKMLAKCQ